MLDRNSQTPLYIQLAQLIRQKIESGEIRPGDKLMSESEMIKTYSLGRLTIREALSILENEGLIIKQHGVGSFCKQNHSLKKKKINVLLDTEDLYFIPYYLNSICRILESENIEVILGDTQDDVLTICNILEDIVANGSDGVIIQPTSENETPPKRLVDCFKNLEDNGIPYIMVDNKFGKITSSYVMMDEFEAGRLAAQYLKSLGHQNCCMVCHAGYRDSDQRLAGFMSEFDEEPYLINKPKNMLDEVKRMREIHPEITGIFCYNDIYARNFYRAVQSLGLSIPEDYSVVSTDNTVVASTLEPSLTSIAHPKTEVGKAAANAMISIISGKTQWPYKHIFKPSIKERHSCRKLA